MNTSREAEQAFLQFFRGQTYPSLGCRRDQACFFLLETHATLKLV